MWLTRQWRLIGTLVIFAILFSRIDGVAELWAAVLRSSPLALLVAIVLITLDRVLMTYKWIRLLALRGFRLSTFQGMKIYCNAMVWGQFLPSSVGADAVRAYSTTRLGAPAADVVTSIVIERLSGILVTAAAAVGGLVLIGGAGNLDARLGAVWWLSSALVLATSLFVMASINRPLFDLIERVLNRHRTTERAAKTLLKFHTVVQAYRTHKGELALFVALTAAEQLFPIVITLVLAIGMEIQIPLLYVVAGVPIAFLISRIPISLGGLGVHEGILALVFGSVGVPLSQTLVLSLSFRAAEVIAWTPWWIMYAREAGSAHRPQLETETLG